MKSEPHFQIRSKARGGRTRRGGSKELELEREARSQTTRESVGGREAGRGPRGATPARAKGSELRIPGRGRRVRRRATAGSGRHGAPESWRSSPPWPEGCAGRGECVRRRGLRPTSGHSPAGGARQSPVPQGPAALSAPAPSAQQLRAQGTRRPHSPSRDTPGTDPGERVAGGTRLPRTLLQQVGAQGAQCAVLGAGRLAGQPDVRVRRSAGLNAPFPRGAGDSGRVRGAPTCVSGRPPGGPA